MKYEKIQIANNKLNKNLNLLKENNISRGFVAQNVLSDLRTLTEYVMIMLYNLDTGSQLDLKYSNLTKVKGYIKGNHRYKTIYKLHQLLQITNSHYIQNEDGSERLMLEYISNLNEIREIVKNKLKIEILENIELFPIYNHNKFSKFYEEITKLIENLERQRTDHIQYRCYIQKSKPIIFNNKVLYEITLSPAEDNISKFDRILAYSRNKIFGNYAVKITIVKSELKYLDTLLPVNIILGWEVSIRPCELNNFAKIFGYNIKMQSNMKEYIKLMQILTQYQINLLDLVELNKDNFNYLMNEITNESKAIYFKQVLIDVRNLITQKCDGSNIIRYLLYNMTNRVIKQQYCENENMNLNKLFLSYGCIPFDKMPIATSLNQHNPKIYDLLQCIDYEGREHEFLSRELRLNAEQRGVLYSHKVDLKNFEDIDTLINRFNEKLYYTHQNRAIENYRDFLFIKGYDEVMKKIIDKFLDLSKEGVEEYTNLVKKWIDSSIEDIEPQKQKILNVIFKKSRVTLIYGAAGTGKSTLMNYLSDALKDKKQLFLAVTNPAVENLRKKIKNKNADFRTISSVKKELQCELLFIDEASTVCNMDLENILKFVEFEALILVGDNYQIQSINFGNWFNISKLFIEKDSVFELTTTFRTKDKKLKDLWDSVRNMRDDIVAKLVSENFTEDINSTIFNKQSDDEIVLCLNYDGLYGVNNINKIFQNKNINDGYTLKLNTYKVNDPILFNESTRFYPLIHNNMKGRIHNIFDEYDKIIFQVIIYKQILEEDFYKYDDITFIAYEPINQYPIIQFDVNKKDLSDDDNTLNTNAIPFQIAYAVSIHKAQGLEFDSVKVVITDEIEEKIDHSVFYTAITRAKNNLMIYWSPETMNNVIHSFIKKDFMKDANIFAKKYDLSIKK